MNKQYLALLHIDIDAHDEYNSSVYNLYLGIFEAGSKLEAEIEAKKYLEKQIKENNLWLKETYSGWAKNYDYYITIKEVKQKLRVL